MKKIILTLLFLSYISIQVFGGEYLKIKFKSKASIATSKAQGPSILLTFPDMRLNVLFAAYTITDYSREYPIADSFPNYLPQAVRLRLWYSVRISEKHNVKELKARIDAIKSPDVDTVIQANDPIALSTPPNDYYNCFACIYGDLPQAHHHLDLINALGAWDITKGLSCIKIGIVDENFQHHVDLDNKVDITPRTANIGPADTTQSHGVEVAGMAGAETNNNLGISSLGYNVRLQYYDKNYNGILNAIYDGCKVVNCSWATHCSLTLQQPSDDVRDVLTLAELNNVTIIASAGNGQNNPSDLQCPDPFLYAYPASYNNVISVTSVGSQFNAGHSANANWKDYHRIFMDTNDPRYNQMHQNNDRVDICAPGHWVETTARNNNYGNTGGTSLAAPQVSAAAALLYSINPFFTSAQIEAYLKNNAANIYNIQDNNQWLGKLGAGRLDAGASLQAALSNAYTGDYCNSCPSGTTYLTSSPFESLSGYFYNQNIYAGSNNSRVVKASNYTSVNFVATGSIVLTPEFSAVATAFYNSFSARIEPCTMLGGRVSTNNKNNDIDSFHKLPEKEQLTIYRNPTNNILIITYSLPNEGQIDIKIMNSVGVIVKSIQRNSGKQASGSSLVDVKDLFNGLYYVIVRSGSKMYTKNFLKIK